LYFCQLVLFLKHYTSVKPHNVRGLSFKL